LSAIYARAFDFSFGERDEEVTGGLLGEMRASEAERVGVGVDANIAETKGARNDEPHEERTGHVDFEVGDRFCFEGANSLLCPFIVKVGKLGR
jgi:hypothetical protein